MTTSSAASLGSGPKGEAGNTKDGVGLKAGGRRPEARKIDERAMKVPFVQHQQSSQP